jgi:hypothetical protein
MRELIVAIVFWCVTGLGVGAAPATDDWIDGLAGGWLGEDNLTPLGGMDFAKAPGEIRRWLSPDNPRHIAVDLSHNGTTLVMDVRLHGENHARFELERVPDSAIPEMRREFAEAAARGPEEVSIHEVTGGTPVPGTIRSARSAVAADPRSAEAHLRLAQAIGERLQADPMGEGPRFAGEMLKSLRTAIDLDPSMTEAYHWLVGYYLNAPPIAGGSVEQAEKTARMLAEANPDAGRQLLALVEQTKNGRAATH